MKLYLTPTEYDRSNGVGQVVHAQRSLLPEFGIELVDSEDKADLTAAHVTADNIKDLDVLHTHGIYFTLDPLGDKTEWMNHTNRQIADAAIRARAVTTPSQWAGEVFRRDMRISPVVIPNGVSLDEWQPKEKSGTYALWAKNRISDVCNPLPAWQLAELDKSIEVVTTFAPRGKTETANYHVIGRQSFDQMKEILRGTGVLIATTKEVDSLQVKEALACGVPILAFDNYGGTSEVVQHKYNGYLVTLGDTNSLVEGYHWLIKNRAKISKNCIQSAKAFGWQNIIKQYAELYEQVYAEKQKEQSRVAVVIPCYNYGRYLGNALDSLKMQTYQPDEIIIVDDGSTDTTQEVAKAYASENTRIVRQDNVGVAHARNFGISLANSEFVVCLDADDLLEPEYIETCRDTLTQDRRLGIAYTGMQSFDERGNISQWNIPNSYDFESQAENVTPPKNGIPCAAMFRRSMWERIGGYKQAYHPAEDAHFWLMGTSIGFGAKKASDEPLFDYRIHENSASRIRKYVPIHGYVPFAVDKQYPFAAPTKKQPLVRSYSHPVVSVIVPVGTGHEKAVITAIESVAGQSYREWELVLVDDTKDGISSPSLVAYPFVRVIRTKGNTGAGNARNEGVSHAKAPLVLFLDADDYLTPTALTDMLTAFSKSEGKYIYTDYYVRASKTSELEVKTLKEYDQQTWETHCIHGITVLLPKMYFEEIGGFQNLRGYEDWELFLRLAKRGYCGERLAKPCFVYQTYLSGRRDKAQKEHNELLAEINKQNEGEFMACCGSGSASKALQTILNLSDSQSEQSRDYQTGGKIKLIYTGAASAPIRYQANGREYSTHNEEGKPEVMVLPEDVDRLLQLGVFREA